jgi:hypothetical protein
VFGVDKDALNAQAKRIYAMPCCRDKCLHLLGSEKRGCRLVKDCLEEVADLTRHERHDYVFNKLLNATKGVGETGIDI